jgi:TPR repeat protein
MITGRNCPTCNEILKGEWQYCPKCGKRVPSASLEQQNVTPVYESKADILVKEAKQLYFKRKYLEAMEKCQFAADMDNGEACFMMGLLIARGHRRNKTDKGAMPWYMKGREKNNAAAINAIGVIHYKGYGVLKDIEEAISCFRQATDLGDMFAPYNLARCYEQGIGVSQDREKAQEFFLLAIDRGNNYAGDYFETKFFDTDTNESEPEDEDDLCGYVFSKEHWGYLEKTIKIDGRHQATILLPLYRADYYKKNAEFIKEMEESYRRECMYKLPELIIFE